METLKLTGFVPLLLLLLAAALSFTLAADEKAYFMAGGKLRLDPRPAPTEPIANILWKFKGNLVAELVDVSAALDVYDKFQGRTTVDKKTGRLEISSMAAADAGVYTVEINNRVQPGGYDAEMIKAVTEPEVAFKPLSCALFMEKCTVACDGGTTDAGPITYSWRMGEGEWTEMQKEIVITAADHSEVETFTCRVANQFTEKDSKPENNRLYQEKPSHNWTGIIMGTIFGILAAAAAAVFVLWKKGFFNKTQNITNPDSAAENGKSTQPGGNSPAAEEDVPLKDNTASTEPPAAEEDPVKETANAREAA